MQLCGGQTGRGAPGSRKTWPLSVASAPGFMPSPPARGWPVSLAGATRQAPRLVRSSPHPLPQSGARPPPSALQQGCGRGRCESRGPPSVSEQGAGVLWSTTGPALGTFLRRASSRTRGRRRWGKELQPPPAPVSAWWALGRASGLVTGESGCKCVSGVGQSGLLQMEALFTCQRRLVSLPLGISVAGSRRPEPRVPD